MRAKKNARIWRETSFASDNFRLTVGWQWNTRNSWGNRNSGSRIELQLLSVCDGDFDRVEHLDGDKWDSKENVWLATFKRRIHSPIGRVSARFRWMFLAFFTNLAILILSRWTVKRRLTPTPISGAGILTGVLRRGRRRLARAIRSQRKEVTLIRRRVYSWPRLVGPRHGCLVPESSRAAAIRGRPIRYGRWNTWTPHQRALHDAPGAKPSYS